MRVAAGRPLRRQERWRPGLGDYGTGGEKDLGLL